jgi:AcrR family transcriptional regulator
MKATKAGQSSDTSNRVKILDAAEIEFSNNTYEACALRSIADTAGVNLGLVHYYFGGKEGLFAEVFRRRALPLVERRLALLQEARDTHASNPIPVRDLVLAFITPTLEMAKQGKGPQAFIRLHARLRTDSIQLGERLRAEAFNRVNRVFIREFTRSCPHLSEAAVVWRVSAMVGGYLFLLSQSGRVSALSNGKCNPSDIDTAIAQMVEYSVAGLSAPDARKRIVRTQPAKDVANRTEKPKRSPRSTPPAA